MLPARTLSARSQSGKGEPRKKTAVQQAQKRKQQTTGKKTTPTLDEFARDLTEYALQGKLDPVVGRQVEGALETLLHTPESELAQHPPLLSELAEAYRALETTKR